MIELNQMPEIKEGGFSHSAKKFSKIGVAFIILVAFVWGGVKYFSIPSKPFDTLTGQIYLTLAPYPTKDTDTTDLYRYDIGTRKFEKIFQDNLIKYTSKISPDGKKIAFFSKENYDSFNLFYALNESMTLNVYDKETKNTLKLGENFLFANKIGDWSPDGTRLVITGYPSKFETIDIFSESNKWSVDIVDMNKKREHVDSGTNPRWNPNGKSIVYLKNDGIYLYTLATKKSEKVYDIGRYHEAKMNIKFSISPDGHYLSLTSPDDRRFHLYTIDSLDTLALTLIENVVTGDSFASSPVFSPDSRYVVYHQVDFTTPDNKVVYRNPRLMVYDIKTLQNTKLTDLDQHNFDFTSVDGWKN